MAHYAFIDENNTVVEVITGKDEGENGIDWEQYYGEFRGLLCKRTSYNTFGGQHKKGGRPLRKNYAGPGFTYRSELDAFIPPQPYPSWVLNDQTGLWEPPTPIPDNDQSYFWDEENLTWKPVNT